MNSLSFALAHTLPELILAGGALVLLMMGAYKGAKGDWIISELAIAILGVAFLTLFTKLDGKAIIWDGAFVDDAYGRFMKGLALIGALVSLLLSREYMAREKIDQFEFPVLILLSTTGMLMLISARFTAILSGWACSAI